MPPPLAEEGDGVEAEKSSENDKNGVRGLWLKRLPRRVLSVLSNLPLAIGEMATVAALMALGMFESFFSLFSR